MSAADHQVAAADPWAPYVPTADAPWDRRRVVHLYRRAGFAASWAEIERDLREGPQASVDRLLRGAARDVCPAELEHNAKLLADAAVAMGDIARLKAWWIYRMIGTPDPLRERMTLLWHNHFATSQAKVQDVRAMWRQNEVFRELAFAPFSELLARSLREPALLMWLDAQANRKEHPNENLARELMELFTLGVGNFGERDVKDAARALTGVTVSTSGTYRWIADHHDDGEKAVLGHTGRFDGDELVRILLEHPATARRLALRLCEMLLTEAAADDRAIDTLADRLREHELDIGWAVATILRSRAFFDAPNLGGRIMAPAELVVGAVCALERRAQPPSTLVLAEWVTRLGQDLFLPPNVFGWRGGRAWITTATMLRRADLGVALVAGELDVREGAHVLSLAERHGRAHDLDDVVRFYGELLLGTAPDAWCQAMLSGTDAPSAMSPQAVNHLVGAMLASPEAQVG